MFLMPKVACVRKRAASFVDASTTIAGGITAMLTGAEVLAAPLSSVAMAVRMYVPVAAPVHVTCHGAASASPTLVVPAKNSTLATEPSESAAVAMRVMVSPWLNCALAPGEVIATVGATLEVGGGGGGGGGVPLPAFTSI